MHHLTNAAHLSRSRLGLQTPVPAAAFIAQHYCTPSSGGGGLLLERQTGRSLIRLHGDQTQEFLQSLITNDMRHLQPAHTNTEPSAQGAAAIFTMFLNKAGRVLYDAIVYKPRADIETYLIECDRSIDADLQTHLKIFRVRKKIDIDVVSNELSAWVAFNPAAAASTGGQLALARMPSQQSAPFDADGASSELLTCAVVDPRIAHLGTRIIAAADAAATVAAAFPSMALTESQPDEDRHRLLRYQLGIGEGPDELPVGKCFPLESNADYLHGVSFHKGCYLGQEFTARTHHTGVVRKRLMPVRFGGSKRLTAKSSRHVESTNGVVLGKVRGFQDDCGVALLKYEPALLEEASLQFGNGDDGVVGRPVRPLWWPQEAPSVKKT